MNEQPNSQAMPERRSHQRVVRGIAPELSGASTGWWWLWCDEQWCAAYVTYENEKAWSDESLDVVFLRASGGMSRARLRLEDMRNEKWGGRMDAPNGALTHRESDASERTSD